MPLTARALAGALLLAIAASSAAVDPPAVDLMGTWHVLVHYRDDHSRRPAQLRWDDRIWVFEQKGSRLRWTEYPIVVFKDKAGRFERLGTSGASRVVHDWMPNEKQMAQIRSGLEVNQRGSKTKMLRHVGAEGWRSRSRPRAGSASIITYVENWSVEDSADGPVFRREEVLGSFSSESMEGLTVYATTAVEQGGAVVRGTFERDDIRHGTFRLTRAAAVEGVKGSGQTQSERARDVMFQNFSGAVVGEALEAEVERRARKGGAPSEEARAEIRKEIRAMVEEQMRDQGASPNRRRDEVDRTTAEIERLILDEGHSLLEVEEMFREGKLGP